MKSLTLLINQVINTGIFHEKLKIAKVIPIFKKDDSSLFKNYKPISLLPTISKLLEKTIYSQLYAYFNGNKLYFENQYGFRQTTRLNMQHLELADRIITQMVKNDVPLNIFLDFSKAFGTIDHSILLNKLTCYGLDGTSLNLLDHSILLNKLTYYGLDGTSLNLFKSYLKNRSQFIPC